MTIDEVMLSVVAVLEDLGTPYMVVGSFSSNFYGRNRTTQDVDLVIELGQETISQLAIRLGASFRVVRQMSFETATGTYRHEIEVPGTSLKAEMFHLSDDDHDQERFRRRRREVLLDRETWLPTVEDVVITKLRWADRAGRLKDRNDVQTIINVRGKSIDWDYVNSWADRHGTRALLDEIRKSIPPL
jgi:hypothetical protein